MSLQLDLKGNCDDLITIEQRRKKQAKSAFDLMTEFIQLSDLNTKQLSLFDFQKYLMKILGKDRSILGEKQIKRNLSQIK